MSVQPHEPSPVQTQFADVVLHAERIKVARRWVPMERVRVHREVITEEVTVTVTVRREVLRLERESLDKSAAHAGAPGGNATSGAGTEDELEVVLSTERPVVSVEVVPYERVVLGVRSVSTSTPVSVDVRHEVAEVITNAP